MSKRLSSVLRLHGIEPSDPKPRRLLWPGGWSLTTERTKPGPVPPCFCCCYCCCWPDTMNPVLAAVPVRPERGLSGLRCGHGLGPAEQAPRFRRLFVGPNAPAPKQRNLVIFIDKSTSCVHQHGPEKRCPRVFPGHITDGGGIRSGNYKVNEVGGNLGESRY